MLHQALGEAGHKWHSSQSCFYISFLTQKGIFRPTTLVAFFFFFSHRPCLSPRPEKSYQYENESRWYLWGILELKWEHAEFPVIASCPPATLCRCHHICCFSGHICHACHPEVKPQFLFVDFSSWLAGTIKDVQWLDKFVDFSSRHAAA